MCNYSEAIYRLGFQKGFEIGFQIGQLQQLIKFVLNGKYTIEEAAEEAEMTISAFKETMKSQAFSQPS